MKGKLGILGLVLLLGGVAHAATIRYEFSFTADDLMSYVTASGLDGSTAADNGIFDGGRLVRQNLVSGHTYTRSYVGSEQTAFTYWANSTNDRLISFNLWGLDGRGARWGEDYKPAAWIDQSNPTGWSDWQYNWPVAWGSAPAGYITDEFIGWDASTYGDALSFGDSGNASTEFRFQVDFDTADLEWGANTNGAPNTLPQLTFWFGGYMGNGSDASAIDWDAPAYIYEGNMTLTGTVVPVPAAAGLGFLGMGLVGFLRRRKNTAA